ncbi:unnamed protein product [Urochloa decumbens]|uniref:Uncharacterized protein n=1 Tax=Urochloa decumbens TaxID=240449 RepID=A0ABC8WYI2_9POAL
MAEQARGSRALLICLYLCLLISSSVHLAMGMVELDDDDFFDASFDDDTYSEEVAPARRRLYDERGSSVVNSNTSSNRSGAAFCRLLSLQILDLSNNQLTGELPDCWWEMQALQFMDLSNNSFSVVGGCQQLATLDIGNNNFHGHIPPWIGSEVSALKILSLKSNKFTGEIPSELSQLSPLQLLDLSHNRLTGLIPKEFGKLISMKYPKINSSTGSLDGSTYQDRIDIIWKGQDLIFQRILELMTGIDLSGNSLSHCIPEEITNLQGLRFLNLSGNNFSCSIPQNIGSFKYLESLDLSLNNLSGVIPPSISDLLSLSKLNLSNNHLSGKIPTGSQLQTLTDPSIYSNNPGLCGPPLDINCTNASPALDKKIVKDCDQWLYYCVTAGIVFGFWLWGGMMLSIPKWRRSVFLFVDYMQYKIMLKLQPIDQYLSKEKSDPFL